MKQTLWIIALPAISASIISCATKEMAKEGETPEANVDTPAMQAQVTDVPLLAQPLKMTTFEEPSEGDTETFAKSIRSEILQIETSDSDEDDMRSNMGIRHTEQSPNEVNLAVGWRSQEPRTLQPDQGPSAVAMRNAYVPGPQVRSYPTELYAGENIVVFSCKTGIRSIEPVFDSVSASMIEIAPRDIGEFVSCPDSHSVRIRVNTASELLSIRFKVIDRLGTTSTVALSNRTWRLDEVPFPDVMVGDTTCHVFKIALNAPIGLGIGKAGSEYLDSISIMSPFGFARYSDSPPLQLKAGSTYRYEVCFAPTEPGLYRFPVITWIRRAQPVGGYTNYPVADTAVVRVMKFKQY